MTFEPYTDQVWLPLTLSGLFWQAFSVKVGSFSCNVGSLQCIAGTLVHYDVNVNVGSLQ